MSMLVCFDASRRRNREAPLHVSRDLLRSFDFVYALISGLTGLSIFDDLTSADASQPTQF
ncbi:hypothetical protein XY58_17545 [Stenotrophomonas maltophilia]|nr:hypothetical protein XY58_17545 [Stenotrophomonas maltophilia]MBA0254345.1 hypothetical protein [Stenotrophomonas maltophilia]MBA0451233.1 hypothetical protein [Stenotrophomonas maltophilia]MBA0481809.1 hypothetical protein [Stenotrophomonas maltophilia]MBA0490376.1 hypothetical protein [Stenotrophomonas maltophilia]